MGQKLKIDLFQLVRVQKGPQLIAFFLKINLLYAVIYIPHYIPQHCFRKKSKRGKAKHTTEIREKLNTLTDNLVSDLNIQKLNTNEKIALLRVLLSYTLTRPKVDTAKEHKSFSVKILD